MHRLGLNTSEVRRHTRPEKKEKHPNQRRPAWIERLQVQYHQQNQQAQGPTGQLLRVQILDGHLKASPAARQRA